MGFKSMSNQAVGGGAGLSGGGGSSGGGRGPFQGSGSEQNKKKRQKRNQIVQDAGRAALTKILQDILDKPSLVHMGGQMSVARGCLQKIVDNPSRFGLRPSKATDMDSTLSAGFIQNIYETGPGELLKVQKPVLQITSVERKPMIVIKRNKKKGQKQGPPPVRAGTQITLGLTDGRHTMSGLVSLQLYSVNDVYDEGIILWIQNFSVLVSEDKKSQFRGTAPDH